MKRTATLAYVFHGGVPACATVAVYHPLPTIYSMPIVDVAWCQSVKVTRFEVVRRNHSRLVYMQNSWGPEPIGWVKCRPEQDPR